MFFAVKRDGLIYMPGRDMSYFPRNIHSLVLSTEQLLQLPQDRLLEIYNRNAEIPVKDFPDHATAQERVRALLNDFSLQEIPMARRNENSNPDTTDATQTQAPAADGAPQEQKASSARIPKSAIIRLKTTANPKRPGSAAHARFALYVDGQTVEDFIKAGGTMGDVNFDAGKGFIALEGIGEPEPAAADPAPAAAAE